MAAAVPRLDLGQDGDQAYSPSSAPFSLRPAARTPAGRSLLLSTNPLFDQGADSTIGKPGIHEGEQTPRLGASGKLSDLKSAPGPVSSARKWLAGQARSPAGAALAGSAASPALASASPLQLPAAAAAQLAADAPTPRLLSSAGKLTPRTDTGVAPSPATQFPRSFPVAVGAKPQVTVEPTRGLASWLRMSSHLSKPTEAATEPHSPAGSDVSGTSSGSDGTRPRTVASLDFTVAQVKAGGGVDSTTAAPAAPAAEPAATPPAPATSAVAVTGKTGPSAAAGQPVQTGAKRRAAAVRSERSSLLSLPAVQLLLLCLLGGLLLAAPLTMHAFNPTLTQRYLQDRVPDVTAYILQLRTTTSRHVSELSAAAAHSATRLKVAASHHGRQLSATAARGAARLKVAASHHGSQLQATVLQQAQLARATVQQAQQKVTQAFHRHVAAAKKAFPATTSPSKLTAKAAAVTAQQQALRQAQPSKARAAVSAAVQAAVPKPQPAAPKSASQAASKATTVPDVVKALSKTPANVPVTQPKQAPARASSPVPPAVKPQAQPASKTIKPQAATKSAPQAAAAKSKPPPAAVVQPAVRAKPAAQPQQAAAVVALHSQAAAFAAARLAPVWQQLRARLPFLAPPAAPAVAEAAAPLREVQPSALAAAAAAAVAGLAALVALGARAAGSYDAAQQEEAALDQKPAALPAFPTTTPAVGGRASRTRRQSEAVIAEAEDEGLPSVVAPRQRRASALPAATPGTAPRTGRRKSAASVDVPPSPTSATTTRRRSMRLAA